MYNKVVSRLNGLTGIIAEVSYTVVCMMIGAAICLMVAAALK